MRLVAVLGYSNRRTRGLHDVCAKRLAHAEGLVADGDVVLLSGWSRHPDGTSEAELMSNAWKGAEAELIVDGTAGSTRGNAATVAEMVNRLGATEVTVVTSRWHAFRARALVRAALPGTRVRSSSPSGRPPVSAIAREVACVAMLPYHLLRIRGNSRR
jgi:uncharacterized SAM-binding protein YcdF (DUF218 family)